MYIQEGDILIRNAMEKDASQLCLWWNDGKVMEHAGFPNGLGTTEEKIKSELAEDDDENCRRCIIEWKGKPIGEMVYRRKDEKTAEIGIKICDFSAQDRGIGTKILQLFIQSLFEDYHYERIVLDTMLENKRAQHVYEKLGFQRVRVNQNVWRDQTGCMRTSVDYVLEKEG